VSLDNIYLKSLNIVSVVKLSIILNGYYDLVHNIKLSISEFGGFNTFIL